MTPRLKLPYIAPSQAQKHVTHNEALRMLDALVQATVSTRTTHMPPAQPQEGEAHIVPAGAGGEWGDKEGAIAAYQDGAWTYLQPQAGWRVWVTGEAVLCIHDGVEWLSLQEAYPISRLDALGVNTDASEPNRLAVSGAASLFDHAGGGHQLKINRSAAGHAGSLLFQTAYSGRAEIGLPGDDNWRLKVSENGTVWHEAISVDRRSGGVSVRFLDSHQVIVGYEQVGVVQPPSSGGIVFFSIVDAQFPQNPTASILAYDVGNSPLLTTMFLGTATENRGTTALTGTTGTSGRISVAVDGAGNLFIENRFTGGVARQFCLTFINSYRQLV